MWLAVLVSQWPAFAETRFVNLAPFVNADLTGYTRGAAYPQSGGHVTVNGVEFELAARADGRTGVVQAFSDSAVHIDGAPGAHRENKRFFGFEETIPVYQHNVESLDVLMNSAFGRCGARIGELVLVGGKHEFYRYPLVEGKNIRDHNYGSFCNMLADFAGEANYGNVRLDFQRIELPERFSGNLLAIVFRGFNRGPYAGAPFLAAITLNISSAEANSTIRYGAPVANTQHACLMEAKPCTPPGASITKEEPKRYGIILPADLVLGAAIPNPNHAPVEVEIEGGVVCMGDSQASCTSAAVMRQPAGPGYLNPTLPAGALTWMNIGAETVFSVNGRISDEVPIAGSPSKKFRGYAGGIEFKVTIR
jgi:hypothetical protein